MAATYVKLHKTIAMVRFEKDKYIIEVHTGCNPIESWQELHAGLCDLLRNVNQDNVVDSTFYTVPDFLSNLMPEWETARKMTD